MPFWYVWSDLQPHPRPINRLPADTSLLRGVASQKAVYHPPIVCALGLLRYVVYVVMGLYFLICCYTAVCGYIFANTTSTHYRILYPVSMWSIFGLNMCLTLLIGT